MVTSIFYCIKDPIPFLIIGGTSGIGKTAIIDFLLAKYPQFFEQPLNYTSRQKRDETDRYIFISRDEMVRLNQSGEFINFDEVHNVYYGIKKNEISRIKGINKIRFIKDRIKRIIIPPTDLWFSRFTNRVRYSFFLSLFLVNTLANRPGYGVPINAICRADKIQKDGTSLIFVQYCFSATKRTLLNTEMVFR